MAFDGIVLSHIVNELKQTLLGGRIDKVQQPEKDEIVLSVRAGGSAVKVLLSANSSYPRLHLLANLKQNPLSPPMFCMLLRKHLSGGKILDISQPDFERIVVFDIEATNELGDKETKKLIIEMMGRHSNIILTKPNGTILDSIKHVSLDKSSVRQVLPNGTYVFPPTQGKDNPLTAGTESFHDKLLATSAPLPKSLYLAYSGVSPLAATQILRNADLTDTVPYDACTSAQQTRLTQSFLRYFSDVRTTPPTPRMYLDASGYPVAFHTTPLTVVDYASVTDYASPSEMVEAYYTEKSTRFTVAQKTADIKKLLTNFLERNLRKKAIQETALEESSQSEQYKIYGELLTAYAHEVPGGAETFTTLNYYEEPYTELTIPLDKDLSAIANAQAYFKKYQKAKRTLEKAHEQLALITEELSYLQSVLLSLDLLENEQDIYELRQELAQMGYLKKRKVSKQKPQKNACPYLTFTSSTGLTIYVGKNNYQNDALTMKFAKPQDMWLHVKDGAGSHVIVALPHPTTLDDTTLVEAATLAAYFSKSKDGSHVAVDYTPKKNVKKIPQAKPGMVIYQNFKTVYVTPTESLVKQLSR